MPDPDLTKPVDAAARAFWDHYINANKSVKFDDLDAGKRLQMRDIVLPLVQAVFPFVLESAGYVDETGMPTHLPMAVDEDGNGPIPPWQAHHYRCWCMGDDCEWMQALQAADDHGRAQEALRTAGFLQQASELYDGPLAPHLATQDRVTALSLKERAKKLLEKYQPKEDVDDGN